MATMHQKPGEAGWFYHAPEKRPENPEPVGAPPASQIPGLGEINVLPREQPKEMVFRDTDSKYVRLAKMGGKKDLLTIRPNSVTKKEPKSYPRNDWFYLEDNAQQTEATKGKDEEPWQFLLPEYMVHQAMGEAALLAEYPNAGRNGVPMRRAPYATDQQVQHVGRRQPPSVKTPKTKQPSFDTRVAKKSSKDTETLDCSRQPLPLKQEELPNMTKLLSYKYGREFSDKREAGDEAQDKNCSNVHTTVKSPECRKSDGKPSAVLQKSSRRQSSDANNNKVINAKKPEEKKQPFKLSKFKNVASRCDTRQSAEILAAMAK